MKKGSYPKQPYFTDKEIDRVCIDKLRLYDCLPYSPEQIRIDRFVEKCFGIVPEYQDLPSGVLGYTQFGTKGVEAIYVSRSLDEAGDRVSDRRIRTTIAHEAGHGILHAHLFEFSEPPQSLFPDDIGIDQRKILCREDLGSDKPYNAKNKTYDGRWWEFQANRAMASFLLPHPLVLEALSSLLTPEGLLGNKVLKDSNRIQAEKIISDIFEVNPIVARIRMDRLFPVKQNEQLTL
jgi:hypothetical protein